jgi:zinc/manganese transport system permease protein
MDMSDLGILGPALVAGLLVLISHIPLGREVLQRGIIFIDLAIAQIAGLGVIIAVWFGFDTHDFAVQFFAIAAAMLGAWILSLLEQRLVAAQEAIIGVVFILAATASILLLSDNPHGSEHIKDLLVGQILWVRVEQLLMLAIVTTVIMVLWYAWRSKCSLLFYPLFALAITSSVQLVGVYLVFASLIIPALTAHGKPHTHGVILAYSTGIAGYVLGLGLSMVFDVPTGALIVWLMACAGVILALIYNATKTNSTTL